MATNYPSGLDSLSNPAGSDALSTGHASQHANANDAIEAIEGELGLNPRGGSATVKARFDAIEANSWVTSARIADGTITGTDIASGTVATANVADGAITPIKTSSGYVAKAALYTATNDDRVIDCTTGTYTITLPTAASQTGRTFIIRNSGTGVITIGRTGAETIAGATSQTLAGYGHLEVVSNGTNWLVLRGTYTDESVGRRIFTWDTVNNRWQMTYGDTGVRTGGTSLGSGWSATWDLISRTGNIVTLNMILVKSGSVTVSNSEVLTTLPAGFRPQTSTYYITGQMSSVGRTDFTLTSAGALQFYGSTTGTISSPTAYVQVSYRTNDAWPASLPGSASGSIPQ